jgi:hypothetical protein
MRYLCRVYGIRYCCTPCCTVDHEPLMRKPGQLKPRGQRCGAEISGASEQLSPVFARAPNLGLYSKSTCRGPSLVVIQLVANSLQTPRRGRERRMYLDVVPGPFPLIWATAKPDLLYLQMALVRNACILRFRVRYAGILLYADHSIFVPCSCRFLALIIEPTMSAALLQAAPAAVDPCIFCPTCPSGRKDKLSFFFKTCIHSTTHRSLLRPSALIFGDILIDGLDLSISESHIVMK